MRESSPACTETNPLARRISPYHHLRKNGPPTLILFGTEDRLLQQAPPFIAKAKELGNRVELYTAEGQGHGFFNQSPWLERTLERMDEFLVEIGYLPPPDRRRNQPGEGTGVAAGQ